MAEEGANARSLAAMTQARQDYAAGVAGWYICDAVTQVVLRGPVDDRVVAERMAVKLEPPRRSVVEV
jgi:hypothetical protein